MCHTWRDTKVIATGGAGSLPPLVIIKFVHENGGLSKAGAGRGTARVSPRCLCLSLSGNHLKDEGCRLVTKAVSQLHIAQKLE